MKNGYTSSELFHFVGRRDPNDHETNYRLLLEVIRQRCVSHPPHTADWGTTTLRIDPQRSLLSEELVVPTVTCFCDIPFDQLAIHVTKYGHFGLSFSRQLLVKYGARPVTYVPVSPADWGGPFGATMLRDIECIYRSFRALVLPGLRTTSESRSVGREPATPDDALSALNSVFGKDFLAFIKPFDSTLADNDRKNFYLEREWRKFGNLCFEHSDIQRIVVEQSFINRLQTDEPDLANNVYPSPVP